MLNPEPEKSKNFQENRSWLANNCWTTFFFMVSSCLPKRAQKHTFTTNTFFLLKGIFAFLVLNNANISTKKSILRFILPCKSECQPIFLKKHGIYSLYAKLWLLRPLIKNFPDSSHRYGSNVTFGASLAFQMQEEYVLKKNIFFKTWPQGG